MWLYFTILSALIHGVYDVTRKHALRKNAVLSVLFIAMLAGGTLFAPILLISGLAPGLIEGTGLYVRPLDLTAHAVILVKATIVSAAWVLAYAGLKHLPVSVAIPIGSLSPVFTLCGALLILGERPTIVQWIGLAVILLSYYSFSLAGAQEGINFLRNKWVWAIVASALFHTTSALVDKTIVPIYGAAAVQAWFAVYLVGVTGAVLMGERMLRTGAQDPFRWRWTVPAVGVLLCVSDFVYFRALQDPDSLIAVVDSVRRCSVIVSFALGGILFREVISKRKILSLAGILAGVILLVLARR